MTPLVKLKASPEAFPKVIAPVLIKVALAIVLVEPVMLRL